MLPNLNGSVSVKVVLIFRETGSEYSCKWCYTSGIYIHNPKDLAISISLEAAELLEVFQWSAEDVRCEEKKDKITEELADVLNYCILMADTCGLDMDEIIQEKIKKNAEKYPVEKAYGHKEKYTEL